MNFEDIAAGVSKLETVVDTSAEDPDDLAGGLEDPSVLLLDDAHLGVDEEVRQFLEAAHTERAEEVASPPMTEDERKLELIGVEMDEGGVLR